MLLKNIINKLSKYNFINIKLLLAIVIIFNCSPYIFSNKALPVIFEESKIDERLGQYIDNTVMLTNADGVSVSLDDYLGKYPVLINFAYFTCPKLCHFIVNEMVETLSKLSPRVLNDVQILTISFDHRDNLETVNLFKNKYFEMLQTKTSANLKWNFLFADETSINQLTSSVGYNYKFNEKTKIYSHPSALIFISPNGMVSRYLYGLMYNPFDFKMSILEAKRNKSVSTVDFPPIILL